ncbi:MAG: carboxypeptidase regulatory-like domain-containing protein, partial [Verrucomicrobiales bacterium]|nr:carboxypeptidase regulatory-like domain-containing protein [Verrucomicrobiales bacterium]
SGTTRGTYHAALLAAEHRARGFGLDPRTEQELLTFLVREALEKVASPRLRGRVLIPEEAPSGTRSVVVLRPVPESDEDSWHLTTCWYDGTFGVRDVPPGTYDVWVQDRLPVPLARVTLGNEPVSGLELRPTETAARIEGRLLDGPDGTPVAAVALALRNTRGGALRTRTSDASGSFRFADLESGTYELFAADGSALSGDPTTISVQAGRVASHTYLVDLVPTRLPDATPTPGGLLSGIVRDAETDVPIAGAYVWIDSAPSARRVVRTGSDGRFVLNRDTPGSVAVAGTARGYLEARLATIDDSQASGVPTLRLAPRGVVSGIVRRRGVALPGTPILLTSASGTFAETVADASGRFAFRDLPEGDYDLGIGAFAGPYVGNTRVSFAPGRRRIQQDLDLDAASLLSGRCVGTQGTDPLPGVLVSLVRDGETVAQTRSDDTGAYAFLVLQAGTYSIHASGTGTLLSPLSDLAVASGLDLEHLDLVAGTQTLALRVVADGTDLPIAEAEVTLVPDTSTADGTGARYVRTDAAGRGSFDLLPAARYHLRVVAPGFAPTTLPAAVPAPNPLPDLRLAPGGFLEGVVSADGAGVPAVRVALAAADGSIVRTTATAADGGFRFDTIPDGALALWVMPEPPWSSTILDVGPIPAGTRRTIDVALARSNGDPWSGKVRFADGRAVPFASVRRVADNGLTWEITHANRERGFRLAAGSTSDGALVATASGHPSARLSLSTIPAGARGSVELVLPAAVALAWAPSTPSSTRASSPSGTRGLQGLGDVFAGIVGGFAAGEVWPEFFGGDYGMQPPQFYMDQAPIDLEEHLGLYELALETSRTRCSGVALGWDQCKSASTFAFRAERDWNDAYRAMRAMNSANSGLIVTRATVVALKGWKLGLGIGKMAKLLEAPETPAEKAMYDGLSTALNADSFARSELARGNLRDVGGWLSGLGTVMNVAQQFKMSERNEKRLKIAGLIREAVSLGKDVYEGYGELVDLEQNVGNGFSAYQAAADNYFRALKQYRQGLKLMQAGLADCRTGGGTQAGVPPTEDLDLAASGSVPIVRSHDPNDKSSLASGTGPFLRAGEPILYTIRFENVPTASAPAQEVRIEDRLDANLDWTSFQPVALGFHDVVVDVPTDARNFSTTTAVASDPYPVIASVRFDARLGLVTWTFRSVDPITGEPPEDPFAGFLPPNDAEGRGEGFVSFSVRPRLTVADATLVTNRAVIAFDLNAPILTPWVTNRVDATPPSSSLRWVGVDRRTARLAWDASDGTGAGVARVEVYRSRDGGPYEALPNSAASAELTLPVEAGSEVALYSIAVDGVGNREAPAPVPDLRLRFPPELTFDAAAPTVLRWSTVPGDAYAIERASRLGPTVSWERVFGPATGDGTPLSFDATLHAPPAFYRLVQIHPSPALPSSRKADGE